MATLFADMYIGEHAHARKAAEFSSSIIMICNILNFLDASHLTLFQGAPDESSSRDRFFESNFESFISCMIASDAFVRRLAVGVAGHLLADESILQSVRASERLDSQQFKTNFWRLT